MSPVSIANQNYTVLQNSRVNVPSEFSCQEEEIQKALELNTLSSAVDPLSEDAVNKKFEEEKRQLEEKLRKEREKIMQHQPSDLGSTLGDDDDAATLDDNEVAKSLIEKYYQVQVTSVQRYYNMLSQVCFKEFVYKMMIQRAQNE